MGAREGPNRGWVAGAGLGVATLPQVLLCWGQERVQLPLVTASYVLWSTA